MRHINDYNNLNNIPLSNRYLSSSDEPVSFNWKKPFKEHKNIIGDITPISKDVYLFCGMNDEIVKILLSQKYDEILTYKQEPKKIKVFGEFKFSSDNYLEPLILEENELLEVSLEGNLYQNSAGRFLGIMKRI